MEDGFKASRLAGGKALGDTMISGVGMRCTVLPFLSVLFSSLSVSMCPYSRALYLDDFDLLAWQACFTSPSR